MSGNALLRFLGVGNLLDREYRNSPAYQWGRELARNGIEADAKTIRFGPEWQGVKATGTYRMQYSDDGHGMSKELLREYMLTLGKGGKVVGGPHDNYALGSRMTLLPWNPEGVVVISVVDGESWMVKLTFDEDAADGDGEYVLEEVLWADESGQDQLSTVYPPYYDADLGFDWADTIPEFITKAGHGTTFVLLGRGAADNTIDGDAERSEWHRYLGRKYFNTRFWELPDGVTLQVYELPEGDSATWPKSPSEGGQFRTVRGAKSLIEYVIKSTGEQFIEDSGTVQLPDGTKVHWWLRTEPKIETGGLGAASAYIAVLYRGELYAEAFADSEDGDMRIGGSVYRQFGILGEVRRRIFLIIDPPEYDEVTGAPGVAPSTGRADLYWMGAGLSSRSVKPADWSEDFGNQMPQAITDAVNAEYASRENNDDKSERLKKVADRFAKRWRADRARVEDDHAKADTTTTPTTPGTSPRQPIDQPSRPRKPRKRKKVIVRGRAGANVLGQPGAGDTPARTTSVSVGIPDYLWGTAEHITEEGMLAAWTRPNANYPSGCVVLDKDHPVVRGQVEFWQKMYPVTVGQQIEEIVLGVYAEVAVAKVAHMHALKSGAIISEDQLDEMLLNPALTTGMLGLISEDALIGPRTGKLGTKRRRVEEADVIADATTPAA